jgi:hypothetical protein
LRSAGSARIFDTVGELSVSGGFAALMCGESLTHRRRISFLSCGYAANWRRSREIRRSGTYGRAKPIRTSERQSRKNEIKKEFANSIIFARYNHNLLTFESAFTIGEQRAKMRSLSQPSLEFSLTCYDICSN